MGKIPGIFLISLLVFLAPACGSLWISHPKSSPVPAPLKTIADRLAEYGPAARRRLKPDFERIAIPYPGKKLVFLGLKEEKRMEVWVSGGDGKYKRLKTYPVLAASGYPGPKLRQGDWQVPEGIYPIESLNPNSRFHLSLRIGYPNEFDREMARREGREKLGGDIMIHGNKLSVGCLAVGDEAAEDLFIMAAEAGHQNISVILSPVDFRKKELPKGMPEIPVWMRGVYEEIRAEMAKLEQ